MGEGATAWFPFRANSFWHAKLRHWKSIGVERRHPGTNCLTELYYVTLHETGFRGFLFMPPRFLAAASGWAIPFASGKKAALELTHQLVFYNPPFAHIQLVHARTRVCAGTYAGTHALARSP